MEDLKVHIVDDEPLARQRLERLVSRQPGFRVSGTSASASQALAACASESPDVLLLDVHMPGGDGVSLARDLARAGRSPAVIFTTAHEDHAVDAFAVRALDYLIKPIRPERLAESLERARNQTQAGESSRDHLTARVGDRLVVIPLDDIRLLLAEDKYTSVHYPGGVVVVEESLVYLEEAHPDRFIRIHRNALVPRAHVRELFRDGEGRACVRIDACPIEPEVSRRNLAALKRALTGK